MISNKIPPMLSSEVKNKEVQKTATFTERRCRAS